MKKLPRRLPPGVDIVRLAGNIGAEIRGVDTTGPLDEEVVATVRAALLAYKAVFLRDQALTYAGQVAFARLLGDLTLGHPIFEAPGDKPHLREIDSADGTRANHWHTDLTFLDRPPAFSLLHSVVVPPVGGDTLWANTASAYADLPPELRDLADRLRIVHSNDSDYTAATVVTAHRDFVSTVYEAEHPAVRVHPETGERSLLLGGFARSVAGLEPQASRDLIRVLQDHATRPEHTVRWRWRPHDLAIWDNQATQHYAIFDYGGEHRRGERVTVAGPAPVGVDGRVGVTLRGDASRYHTGEAA
ncbi:TauD/TfdA dioxygenase family protein [Streptomyces sp. NPDC003247]|uniref:TauD/TfdA dioxygenase family protein n=1 Tax=Streptomyces sp. NPDC003247 TaxID=3364677 RepID=UPI0036A20BE9